MGQAITSHPGLVTLLTQQFAQRGMCALLLTMASEADVDSTLAALWPRTPLCPLVQFLCIKVNYGHPVDGAVVAAGLGAAHIAEFTRPALPFVLFNRSAGGDLNTGACDHYAAARILAARLASAWHKQFAFVDGRSESSVAQERRRGLCDRLAEPGLPRPLMVHGQFDYASGARAMREILPRSATLPHVVVCSSDLMAIGCIDSARVEFDLSIPRDLSVTGFDGIAASTWQSDNLTTVRLPIAEMALATADMFAGLATGTAAPQQSIFSGAIVDGGTARLGPAA